MEAGFTERISVTEMIQKTHDLSFLGRRSFVPRPLSEATEIYDTDFEDDDDDFSPSSLDSRSTLSGYDDDLVTPPPSSGLEQYDFRFEQRRPISGPTGPHLFYAPPSKTEVADLIIALSPVEPVHKKPQRSFSTLHRAVAQLDETQVQQWTPRQVASWMTEAGFEVSVVNKFLIHDIGGAVLLDLQLQDLKELDIASFGKRHQVMNSIQQLRNSSMLTAGAGIRRPSTSGSSRPPSRTTSQRRGRHNIQSYDDVVPEESASIVAIQSRHCTKGEDYSTRRRQRDQIQKLEEEFTADVKSIIAPSVAASSDVLGPSSSYTITAERLSGVRPRDPQENVRQFLNFQHVNSPLAPSPPPALSAQTSRRLNGLPKLQIPTGGAQSESPFATPISALRNPTEFQAKLKAELQNDPYHYGGVASPVDVYRVGTPMSATDIPVTALPIDPCERNASQSVPPEMKFGHSTQTARRVRRPSFVPIVTPVRERSVSPARPVISEQDLATHAGWMKKRKTARMLRHEWSENYFNLHGNKLDMLENETASSALLQSIDVDEYVVHAYSTASSSKLSAAFKKSIAGGASVEPTFAFSLIPEQQKSRKFFSEKEKTHHFAVDSGKDRVEWMRKLMLAKAMKKNDGQI